MAYLATVPPIQFINLDYPVGPQEVNNPDDVFIVKTFLRYLLEHRPDLQWTSLHFSALSWPSAEPHATLFQMIKDYQAFKRNHDATGFSDQYQMQLNMNRGSLLFPNEWGGRVLPQNERTALEPFIMTTIMALNSDIRSSPHKVTWPGVSTIDSISDVMSRYPGVARVLSGLPVREDMDWRELARKRIPWNQWLLKQKNDAIRDRYEEVTRGEAHWVGNQWVKPSERERDRLVAQYAEADWELTRLLWPYLDDIRNFEQGEGTRQTETLLDSTPNPSAEGQYVTFTATIRSLWGKAPVPQGNVTFDVHRGPNLRLIQSAAMGKQVVIGDSLSVQQLGKAPVLNGVATLSTNVLRKGVMLVTATFPGWGNLPGSKSEGLGQVVT
jgi:hypothetical protein